MFPGEASLGCNKGLTMIDDKMRRKYISNNTKVVLYYQTEKFIDLNFIVSEGLCL